MIGVDQDHFEGLISSSKRKTKNEITQPIKKPNAADNLIDSEDSIIILGEIKWLLIIKLNVLVNQQRKCFLCSTKIQKWPLNTGGHNC